MTIETTTVIITGATLAILNFISVFGALATLRWVDRKQKKAIANIFMQELGEKIQTETNFQTIINNMEVKPKDEKGDNNG
jgi:hypothetical protein